MPGAALLAALTCIVVLKLSNPHNWPNVTLIAAGAAAARQIGVGTTSLVQLTVAVVDSPGSTVADKGLTLSPAAAAAIFNGLLACGSAREGKDVGKSANRAISTTMTITTVCRGVFFDSMGGPSLSGGTRVTHWARGCPFYENRVLLRPTPVEEFLLGIAHKSGRIRLAASSWAWTDAI
jgi:hypothetical protein